MIERVECILDIEEGETLPLIMLDGVIPYCSYCNQRFSLTALVGPCKLLGTKRLILLWHVVGYVRIFSRISAGR